MAWIKFRKKEDELKALFEVFKAYKIGWTSYIGGIHNVPNEALEILKKEHIHPEEAKKEEVVEALKSARKMSLG
ncbi:MAG: hypothetical protein HY731_06115 [Candidatus Tectomicrobia bacterium]|nr:hypothetical protein [Candidatus Tectomicrobia bacterium]